MKKLNQEGWGMVQFIVLLGIFIIAFLILAFLANKYRINVQHEEILNIVLR